MYTLANSENKWLHARSSDTKRTTRVRARGAASSNNLHLWTDWSASKVSERRCTYRLIFGRLDSNGWRLRIASKFDGLYRHQIILDADASSLPAQRDPSLSALAQTCLLSNLDQRLTETVALTDKVRRRSSSGRLSSEYLSVQVLYAYLYEASTVTGINFWLSHPEDATHAHCLANDEA